MSIKRNETSPEGLDQEYRKGRWSFLGNIREMSRHGIIASWMMGTGNTETILDIGCGEGHFYRRIEPLGLKRYVGVDLSEEPLAKANSVINPEIANLERADLREFIPAEAGFNAIIFNEVLNYAEDAADQVERYADFLAPGGIIAVSIYAPVRPESGAHKRIADVWTRMNREGWEVLDDITLTSHIKDTTWRMKLVRPEAA
ncbi:MAG: class I SAM-dependent methyltransferase [Stappiaceae bacterium]